MVNSCVKLRGLWPANRVREAIGPGGFSVSLGDLETCREEIMAHIFYPQTHTPSISFSICFIFHTLHIMQLTTFLRFSFLFFIWCTFHNVYLGVTLGCPTPHSDYETFLDLENENLFTELDRWKVFCSSVLHSPGCTPPELIQNPVDHSQRNSSTISGVQSLLLC